MLRFRGRKFVKVTNYLVLSFHALLIIIPIYYVIVSSMKDNAGIFGNPLGLPQTLTIENYKRVQERVEVSRAVAVSFYITSSALLIILVVSFFAAYGISRVATRFESKRVALITEAFFGLGFLIPGFALLVPIFLLAAKTGMLYNPVYIVIYYVAANLPLSVLMLASYMRAVPRELEEAAELDGADWFLILRHVIFPLCQSGIITIMVLDFIAIWNEYLFALILLDSKFRTIQVAIPLLKTTHKVNYGLISAGVVAALLPVVIFFILFQERIIKGMLSGSLKQ